MMIMKNILKVGNMMNSETIIEVAKTLIGITKPVGDYFKDNMSFENQQKLIELTENCVDMLIDNCKYKDRQEYGAERIGISAVEALRDLKGKISKYV